MPGRAEKCCFESAPAPRRITAKPQQRRRRRFGGAGVRMLSQVSPDQGISLHQQKSPTRHLGASGIALSREERGPLRHGRVAWLTAFSADHSGGAAAALHGPPRLPPPPNL